MRLKARWFACAARFVEGGEQAPSPPPPGQLGLNISQGRGTPQWLNAAFSKLQSQIMWHWIIHTKTVFPHNMLEYWMLMFCVKGVNCMSHPGLMQNSRYYDCLMRRESIYNNLMFNHGSYGMLIIQSHRRKSARISIHLGGGGGGEWFIH